MTPRANGAPRPAAAAPPQPPQQQQQQQQQQQGRPPIPGSRPIFIDEDGESTSSSAHSSRYASPALRVGQGGSPTTNSGGAKPTGGFETKNLAQHLLALSGTHKEPMAFNSPEPPSRGLGTPDNAAKHSKVKEKILALMREKEQEAEKQKQLEAMQQRILAQWKRERGDSPPPTDDDLLIPETFRRMIPKRPRVPVPPLNLARVFALQQRPPQPAGAPPAAVPPTQPGVAHAVTAAQAMNPHYYQQQQPQYGYAQAQPFLPAKAQPVYSEPNAKKALGGAFNDAAAGGEPVKKGFFGNLFDGINDPKVPKGVKGPITQAVEAKLMRRPDGSLMQVVSTVNSAARHMGPSGPASAAGPNPYLPQAPPQVVPPPAAVAAAHAAAVAAAAAANAAAAKAAGTSQQAPPAAPAAQGPGSGGSSSLEPMQLHPGLGMAVTPEKARLMYGGAGGGGAPDLGSPDLAALTRSPGMHHPQYTQQDATG
jgi:hypothetical protein